MRKACAVRRHQPVRTAGCRTRHLGSALLAGALAAAVLAPLPACSSASPRADWNAHLVAALCRRAESALAAGDVRTAHESAREALALAERQADALGQARALQVLGLTGDEGSSARAEALLRAARPGPALWSVRLGLAEAALGAGDPIVALQHLDPLLAGIAREDDVRRRASAEAVAHHLASQAHRLLGRPGPAASHASRARLALTLLPEADLLPLRREVEQAVGDDLAAGGDPRGALAAHARASALARLLDDRPAEWLAVRALAHDLAALGRPLDAADHAERVLRAALAHGDARLAVQVAHEALRWLDAAGLPGDAERRRPFLAALEAGAPGPSPDGRASG